MNKKKIGIYAGSFNPFTIGHLNILQKAERILGKGNIIVAIGSNPAKTSTTDFSERAKILSEKLGTPVISYSCFLHELILQKEEEGYEVKYKPEQYASIEIYNKGGLISVLEPYQLRQQIEQKNI